MKRPLFRMRLSQRFTLVFSLIIVVATGTLFVSMDGYFRSTLTQNAEKRAERLGTMMADVSRPHLLQYDYLTLQMVANGMVDGEDVLYAIVLDQEGKVAGSGGKREDQGLTLDDEETLAALAAAQPEVRRQDWIHQGQPVRVAEAIVPVRVAGSDVRWGTVRLGLSMERVEHQLYMTRLFLGIFGSLSVLVAVIAATLLARRISRPLQRLVDATHDLESGTWDPTFRIDTGDEIGELAERFGAAALSLEQQKRKLVEAKEELIEVNAGLEDTVQRRTGELTASREKYRLLVQGSFDAFVLLDESGIIFVNPAFSKIFEVDMADVESGAVGWRDVIHPSFHDAACDQFSKLAEPDSSFRDAWTAASRDGRAIDLEVRGRGVRYQGRDVIELVLTDATEKNRLIQESLHNERLRAMGEMTALVAHNFNNLLAIIHGRAQLVARKVGEDTKLAESLDVIQASVRKAGNMVRHLQDFFGEQADIQFESVEVNQLIQETLYYQERTWSSLRRPGAPPISTVLKLSEIPSVRGSTALLQDALGRIFTNAVEAMPEGGKITVRSWVEDGHAHVAVRDTGTGMDKETCASALEPFYTTKASRGLGLSSSLGILQRHEGYVRVESEEGKGAEITFAVPIESAVSKVIPFRGDEGESGSKLGIA